jgi:hypothetical protein
MAAPASSLMQMQMQVGTLGVTAAWALVCLGVAHVVFGILKYRKALRDALVAGFVGGFAAPELRRTAFWFVIFGLPLLLAGHLAVRAAGRGDAEVLCIIGSHVLVTSLIGTAAFPRSPFPAALTVAAMLIVAGTTAW